MIRHHQQYFDYPYNVKLRNFLLENRGNGNQLHKLSGVNISPYKGGRTKLTSKKYNELVPFINQIKSSYKEQKKQLTNKIYIDSESIERSDIVKDWCSRYKLRTKRLSNYVFPNMNDDSKEVAIALVKKYEYVINDSLWGAFTDGMSHVERMENMIRLISLGNLRINYIDPVTLYRLETTNIDRFILSFCNKDRGFLYSKTIVDEKTFGDEVDRYISATPPRKAHVNNWLLSDKKVKLRLANVAYILNYSENKDDLTKNTFSLLIDNDFFTDEKWKQIQSIMAKVDTMINQNHPFVLAAKYKR